MADFPVEQLVPLPGTLSGVKGDVRVAVPIRSFNLTVDRAALSVETSLRLDFVNLPTTDFVELSGNTFRFPRNPDEGFIDASIYIDHSHHPADVTRIKFGSISLEGIAVEMDVELAFEFEGLGDFRNARWLVSTALRHE